MAPCWFSAWTVSRSSLVTSILANRKRIRLLTSVLLGNNHFCRVCCQVSNFAKFEEFFSRSSQHKIDYLFHFYFFRVSPHLPIKHFNLRLFVIVLVIKFTE